MSGAPQAYRIKHVAALCNVSERTVRRLIAEGRLRAIKLNRTVLIPADEVRRLLATEGQR